MATETTTPADINAWAGHLTRRLNAVEEAVVKLASQRDEDQNPAISAANSLIQMLGELRHVRSELRELTASIGVVGTSGAEERLPSLVIEDMAKGPPKIVTKSYGEHPLTRELIDQHLEAHAYAHAEAERRFVAGWTDTVAAGKPDGWST